LPDADVREIRVKGQCSYQGMLFKRIAAQCSAPEKTALFSKTATEFYRLKPGC
jgi:hypothetical protein